ncbi:MAG: DUF1573 domain-containing protein [Desulfobacterales bacterium]
MRKTIAPAAKNFFVWWVAVAGSFLPGAPAAAAGPVLSVSERTFEFPPVLEGDTVVHEFAIANRGDAPLLIHQVRADCGCTAVSYPRHVPPGAEGKIRLRLDTAGYGGRRVVKAAEVLTSDPAAPALTLRLAGEVQRLALIEPRVLHLRGEAGQRLRGEILVQPEEAHPFRILEARAGGGMIRVEALAEERNGRPAFRLRVENVRTDAGSFNDTIRLKTDHPRKPELDLRVFVYLRPPADPAGPERGR